MKSLFLTTMLILPIGAGMALSQESSAPLEEAENEATEVEATEPEQLVAESIVREQAPNELRLDWITGTTVRSPDGETIGNVNDLIFDRESGEISAAILSVGGFLGIGAKQIAVAWPELQIDYDANEITMSLTREEADAAPEYTFREQEQPPAPEPATGVGTGTGTGMGTGTGTGMGTGTGTGGTTGGGGTIGN